MTHTDFEIKAAELMTKGIKEFYQRAYEEGFNAGLLENKSGGAYAYRQGYLNGRRDQALEDNQCGI